MRIIDKQKLMECPDGTLFCEYTPCVFGNWCIKHETIRDKKGHGTDFIFKQLNSLGGTAVMVDTLDKALTEETSFSFDLEDTTRDGLYDDEQLYAVYENDDIGQLIRLLMSLAPYHYTV